MQAGRAIAPVDDGRYVWVIDLQGHWLAFGQHAVCELSSQRNPPHFGGEGIPPKSRERTAPFRHDATVDGDHGGASGAPSTRGTIGADYDAFLHGLALNLLQKIELRRIGELMVTSRVSTTGKVRVLAQFIKPSRAPKFGITARKDADVCSWSAGRRHPLEGPRHVAPWRC